MIFVLNADGANRRVERFADVALVKALFCISFGAADQRQRPSGDMSQHRVGDCFVIACEIELGYSLLGIENTVGMGQLDSGNLNFHVGTLTQGDDFGGGASSSR